MSDFTIIEFSGFNDLYSDVLRKYDSFNDDFNDVKNMIQKKLEWVGNNPEKVSKTDRIPMKDKLAEGVYALKTRVFIEDAGSKIGRLIWICDTERENIFLTDVYHKNDRINHQPNRIIEAYNEYREEHCEDITLVN